MRWIVLPLSLALALAGCAEAPEDREAAPDTMAAVALAAYDAAMFDTIAWDTELAALERGEVVYNYSCARCHGETGLGEVGIIRAGDTLHISSFQREDWPYTDDKAGLRQAVFVGTDEGMPHWGLEGLKPRDVDAVATYIMKVIRED